MRKNSSQLTLAQFLFFFCGIDANRKLRYSSVSVLVGKVTLKMIRFILFFLAQRLLAAQDLHYVSLSQKKKIGTLSFLNTGKCKLMVLHKHYIHGGWIFGWKTLTFLFRLCSQVQFLRHCHTGVCVGGWGGVGVGGLGPHLVIDHWELLEQCYFFLSCSVYTHWRINMLGSYDFWEVAVSRTTKKRYKILTSFICCKWFHVIICRVCDKMDFS